MARVITLDGLPTANLDLQYRRCPVTETYYSPTLGEEVTVCVGQTPKRRGPVTRRRKVRKGISPSSCTKMVRKRNKRTGKTMCLCVEPKGQILPMEYCKVSRGAKKRSRKTKRR